MNHVLQFNIFKKFTPNQHAYQYCNINSIMQSNTCDYKGYKKPPSYVSNVPTKAVVLANFKGL